MSESRKLVLSATVTHRKADKGKVRNVTLVTVRLGETIAAGATLGGHFTVEQALAEFKRNPKRFKAHSAYNSAVLLCGS
jgi:hypothetical protein